MVSTDGSPYSIEYLFALFAGVGVFFFACTVLSSNAGSIESSKLKAAFAKPSSKWTGVGIGTLVTAIVQSSASTIILVIGFVNAGIMGLPLAATIIYGANIGTTVTAQIVALGMSANVIPFLSSITCIAAFVSLIVKKDLSKAIAGIFVGFGMIFAGLYLITNSMEVLSRGGFISPDVSRIGSAALFVVGFLVTAVVQSSSVTTALIISSISLGIISISQGIYVALGSNIGSCMVVILTGFAGSIEARRASLIHFFFNVIGVIVFVLLNFLVGGRIVGLFSSTDKSLETLSLAMFHTSFKIMTTLVVLPFTDSLIRFVTRLTPEKDDGEDVRFHYIDDFMLRNPPIAIHQLKREVMNMSGIAINNFKIAIEMIRSMDFSELGQFKENEKELNYLNKEIARFLVRVNKVSLSKRDRMYASSVYHTVIDLERIGDYAENIVERAQRIKNANERFSDVANSELAEIKNLVCSLYDKIMGAYPRMSEKNLREAFDIEEKINVMASNMESNHIQRLNSGSCSVDAGVEYISLASDIERIADHFINVGKATKRMS